MPIDKWQNTEIVSQIVQRGPFPKFGEKFIVELIKL